MDGSELREKRKRLKLTQAGLGARLGMTKEFIGMMERGDRNISPRTVAQVSALEGMDGPSFDDGPAPTLKSTDPMERIIERALIRAGIRHVVDRDGAIPESLDFYLPDDDVFIECKRMHSDRVAAQMARAPNVIVAQGEAGVRFLAKAIGALRR